MKKGITKLVNRLTIKLHNEFRDQPSTKAKMSPLTSAEDWRKERPRQVLAKKGFFVIDVDPAKTASGNQQHLDACLKTGKERKPTKMTSFRCCDKKH